MVLAAVGDSIDRPLGGTVAVAVEQTDHKTVHWAVLAAVEESCLIGEGVLDVDGQSEVIENPYEAVVRLDEVVGQADIAVQADLA